MLMAVAVMVGGGPARITHSPAKCAGLGELELPAPSSSASHTRTAFAKVGDKCSPLSGGTWHHTNTWETRRGTGLLAASQISTQMPLPWPAVYSLKNKRNRALCVCHCRHKLQHSTPGIWPPFPPELIRQLLQRHPHYPNT